MRGSEGGEIYDMVICWSVECGALKFGYIYRHALKLLRIVLHVARVESNECRNTLLLIVACFLQCLLLGQRLLLQLLPVQRQLFDAPEQLQLEPHIVALQQRHYVLQRLEDIVRIRFTLPDFRHDSQHAQQILEVLTRDIQLQRILAACYEGVQFLQFLEIYY